jgi:hypothetical protein
MAKITLSTVKSFIKKNIDNLYINEKSKFDGMTDGIESRHNGFIKAEKTKEHPERPFKCSDRTQGIEKAWFVGDSRDYFEQYEDNDFTGIRVDNCCGSFILAVKK